MELILLVASLAALVLAVPGCVLAVLELVERRPYRCPRRRTRKRVGSRRHSLPPSTSVIATWPSPRSDRPPAPGRLGRGPLVLASGGRHPRRPSRPRLPRRAAQIVGR